MDDPTFLSTGSLVEITSTQDIFYVATVIHPPPSISSPNHNLVYVEYHHIHYQHATSSRLKEYVNISYVRPSPVPDTNPPTFQLNDLVDAFYTDSWRTGVVTALVDASNFAVTLRNPPQEVQFRASDLRFCKKWAGGRWFQPQKQVTAGWMFTVGNKVEVSFERESLRGVWFPATLLKNLGNSTFLVEYQRPGAGDETVLHKVTVDYHHIRPTPPYLRDKSFVLLEKVDAYYEFGWWSGVITKELADNSYIVFFKNTKKEREFIYSRVRPHMEWKGAKWYSTSQGDIVERNAHSLIDNQTDPPIIGKQSPVTTSTMKGRRQTTLDRNDKNSPKDEILNDNSSKVNKDPSVGHSDSHDTVVRIAHSLIDSRTEQATPKIRKQSPVIKFTMKRRRPTNLDSNDKNSPKDGILNDDSSKIRKPSVGHSDSNDTVVRKAHSLIDSQIEQAVTTIDKQSPVIKFTMKRRKPTNLDSNDKNSPKDEILNDDPSKIKKPTVGHSDSNDTVVRIAHSLIDSQTEQAVTTIDKQSPVTTSTMKTRRQKNLDSDDKNSPKDEIMNINSVKVNERPSVGHSDSNDTVVKKAHSLKGSQIEQTEATPVIGKQSAVTTSITKRRRLTNLDSSDKNSPKDETKNDGSRKKNKNKNKNPSVGQSEGLDSEVSGMSDQAFSKIENLSHGKKVVSRMLVKQRVQGGKLTSHLLEHSKRGKNIVLKTPTTDSSKKRGKLINELKSLQALTKGSKVDTVKTRTQEIEETIEASKDLPFVMIGLQCNGMTVSQGKIVQKAPYKETPNVAKVRKLLQLLAPAPLAVVDQEGSEGEAASAAPKKKRGRSPKLQALSPKTPVTVNHEIESVVPSTLSEVEAGQRKEAGLTTSLGTNLSKENQGPVNEQPALAEKQYVPSIKDKLPDENTVQNLKVYRSRGKKKDSAWKGKRVKRRTISINTDSPAQDSQDASKEKADERFEKGSTKRNPESYVGGESEDASYDQPLSIWSEGKHSPITIPGPEGTVEQSSKANEGQLETAQCDMDSGNLPFVRNTLFWKTIESMETFRMLPQKPHFRPLFKGVKEGAREGLAIGSMVTFSNLVDETCSLKFDDPRSTIEDCLETLPELENNGFDVEVIRERLTGLLLIKDKQVELKEQSKSFDEKIKEHNIQRKKMEEENKETERQMRELEERRKQVLLKMEKRMSEISAMKAVIEGIKQDIREVGAEFDGLAAAPFVTNNK